MENLFVLVLFPFNGLFVLYLWALTMCNLIQGYVATKKSNYLIGLAVLCLANAFYLPTVLQYKFFEYVGINAPFWIANIIVAIVLSVKSIKSKWQIGAKKWILLYVICNIFGYWGMTGNGDFKTGGILYIGVAVVVFPISYYFYAKSRGVQVKNEGTANSE